MKYNYLLIQTNRRMRQINKLQKQIDEHQRCRKMLLKKWTKYQTLDDLIKFVGKTKFMGTAWEWVAREYPLAPKTYETLYNYASNVRVPRNWSEEYWFPRIKDFWNKLPKQSKVALITAHILFEAGL